MDTLLLISLACFFALFVAALAIARHVRIEQTGRPRERVRKALPEPERERHISAGAPAATQSLRSLTQLKEPDWRFLISDEGRGVDREPSPMLRKRPVSIGSGRPQRPDWAHFNADFGDLSDPYQAPTTSAVRAGGRRRLLDLPRKEAS